MAWVSERSGARGTRYAGIYRDPDGNKRSAGTYSSRREAMRAANREEQKVLSGSWRDGSLGQITFRDYVEQEWLPHKHLEVTTRAAYSSYLNKQFYPAFGKRALNKVSPSVVQDWVTKALADGLSPRSIKKYHVFLSSIFRRAVRDRILVFEPCLRTIGCWLRRSSRPECAGVKSSRCGRAMSTSSARMVRVEDTIVET